MTETEKDVCCPRFDPTPWDEQEITWTEKRFVKDRIRCLLHFPLNFGGVMIRNMKKIEAAGAKAEPMIVVCDENSLWGSDVYIETTKEVLDAANVTLSGTYLCKVFEGPYSRIPQWLRRMKEFVESRGKQAARTLVYYTACPKCAKEHGANYVVLLAEV